MLTENKNCKPCKTNTKETEAHWSSCTDGAGWEKLRSSRNSSKIKMPCSSLPPRNPKLRFHICQKDNFGFLFIGFRLFYVVAELSSSVSVTVKASGTPSDLKTFANIFINILLKICDRTDGRNWLTDGKNLTTNERQVFYFWQIFLTLTCDGCRTCRHTTQTLET